MNQDRKSKLFRIVQVVLVIFVAIDVAMRIKAMLFSPSLPLPVVMVQKPKLESVVEYITQTGNTVAYNAVNLVARVEGYLNAITFVDGTFIKKDTPLFVIEPEPYMAKVREAKASLDAARATDAYNKAEYARQKKMYKENATSLNSVEKWLAKSHESDASIESALANLDIANINYSYTHVHAPFDGRIGRHQIDKGNLVGNGAATVLATIQQLDPIYVYFNLNEIDFLKLREAARMRKDKPNLNEIPVYVSLQGDKALEFEGKLDFLNTSLDASTGTMELRALLSNKDYKLLPNFFVQVRVPTTKPRQNLTIPDSSVLYDQIGPYVLTLDADEKVVLKHITLGSVKNGRRAIIKGVLPQDEVIISGLQNATPGNQVSPIREKKAA